MLFSFENGLQLLHMKRMKNRSIAVAELSVRELVGMLDSGKQPIVIFIESIRYFDSIIDKDFKGRVLSYEVVQLTEQYDIIVDIGSFEEYNRPFMQYKYFKSDGVTKGTYLDIGPHIQSLHFPADIDSIFCRQESNPHANELYEKYIEDKKKHPHGMKYVEWLEEYIYGISTVRTI